MNLDVNENGHIFLINRYNNTLYFFYECHGENKVTKIKFEPEFILRSADSSMNYLVVVGKERNDKDSDDYKHRYKVLNIKLMLECEDHR